MGAGGSKYQNVIPNVLFGKLKVAITGVLIIPGGGQRNRIGLKEQWKRGTPLDIGIEYVEAVWAVGGYEDEHMVFLDAWEDDTMHMQEELGGS